MALKISPYIHFDGQSEQAIRLYERALGAQVGALMRWGEMPGATFTPEQSLLVMHSELRIGESELMVSDAAPGQPAGSESKIQILLNFTSLDETREKFEALAAGGKVIQPLHESFWGATFGILNDAFGIRWLFNCESASRA